MRLRNLYAIWGGAAVLLLAACARAPSSGARFLNAADFLPPGHVTDGSVLYTAELQKAIDAAARDGATLVFPPMTIALDEAGLTLRSRLTLWMHGARFRFDERRTTDGQAFRGENVEDVELIGGEIAGRNDVWADGVNIRGVYITGRSRRLRFRDLYLRDLSSNGIGIFGDAKEPARDVWITDTIVENCCNRYGDYLSASPGPEKGSRREDQGSVALYHVREFVVRGCRLDRSRSDGTHFYRCAQGQISDNRITGSGMGGFFLETCEDVVGSGNVVRDSGSRGGTIERGSRNCIFQGNVVEGSGREGLWAPDCSGLVVTGNVFSGNGKKPNGSKPNQIWNAAITVNEDPHDPTHSPTEDYLISGNLIHATAGQGAAIRVVADKATRGIVIRGNSLRGENRRIVVEGENAAEVTLEKNE